MVQLSSIPLPIQHGCRDRSSQLQGECNSLARNNSPHFAAEIFTMCSTTEFLKSRQKPVKILKY